MKTLIIIPSRLSATRLPGKPLLKINGLSIISHVFKKAVDANIGEVYVATEDQEIVDDVKQNGGQAILTYKKHKTGTDRIYEALDILGKSDIELIMNIQGDEPLINIEDIRKLNEAMIKSKSKLGTLASNIVDKKLYLEKYGKSRRNYDILKDIQEVIFDRNYDLIHDEILNLALSNGLNERQTIEKLDFEGMNSPNNSRSKIKYVSI